MPSRMPNPLKGLPTQPCCPRRPFKGSGILQMLATASDADPGIPAAHCSAAPAIGSRQQRGQEPGLLSLVWAQSCALPARLCGVRSAALGLEQMMHVSRVFLPLVTACMGVSAHPAQHQHRGRTSVPSLEEEIDFLADVLARQDATRPHALRDGKPRTTPSPTGRQRAPSRLRQELLQRGPASSKAAVTLPTSTTATSPKYPVEAAPVPSNDDVVLGLIVVCTLAGISALIVAAVCWCRLQKEVRLAQKADYSAQRVASPLPYDKISPGDKTLAQSAQMYHYQHQKQQMLSMEKHKEEPKVPDSASSDEENEDGDFTVYECPGLAPTGEMEVRNPLFDDSSLHPPNPRVHP
ncbi:neural proliferation differentiation and control protein 1 isoform X1 [Tympanuchus pallidicinctus]|uniref:neural proliferation differentiation and control protein 1 isoform X1 n=1 Tax=Tympanuchus pallidicinctus TaxID=109042 RepID=UPI002286FCA7|nr:neural proliferation differentiation and control protein 1 isoform X1 [Tympanuchus pallidicinctus]